MLNTLNYSEMTQAYMSFVSTQPKWYLNFKDKYYLIDSDNNLWLSNSSDASYNELHIKPITVDGQVVHTIDRSFIRTVENSSYSQTKTYDMVLFSGTNIETTNMSYNFYTLGQSSNQLNHSDIKLKEDTYFFQIPREATGDTFSPRMRGKYLITDIEILSNGTKFTLPYIETTYRYSAR